MTFGGQCGFAARAMSIKGCMFHYSLNPSLFRADSGTNLIKHGENIKGRPCGSVAQLAECSHSKREALGSSPGLATSFSSPILRYHNWRYRALTVYTRYHASEACLYE